MRQPLDTRTDGGRSPSPLSVWQACLRMALRSARDPGFPPLDDFHRELAAAELAGEISEFHALGLQAILSMAREPESVEDYLDMAALVAASAAEQALLAQWRVLHAQVQAGHVPGAGERPATRACAASPDDDQLMALGLGLFGVFRHLNGLDHRPQRDGRGSQAA